MKLVCPRTVKMHKHILVQGSSYTIGDTTGNIYTPLPGNSLGNLLERCPEDCEDISLERLVRTQRGFRNHEY